MNARPIAAVALGLTLGLGLPACIDNQISIRMESVCFPPTPNADGTCSYPTSCDSVLLGNPFVDVNNASSAGTLELPIQVANQMVADGDRAGGLNSKDAWIEKYVISYSSAQVSIPSVTVPITQHRVPAAATSVVIVPVVPPNIATFLVGRVLTPGPLPTDPPINSGPFFISAELVAKGHLADGSAFETGAFTVVFTACANCYAPPDPVDLCNAGDATGTVPYVGSCPQEGQTSIPGCGQ